jgi:hypothetical protein
MAILTKEVNDSLIWYEGDSQRWLRGIGGAAQLTDAFDGGGFSSDDQVSSWTATVVEAGDGDSTAVVTDGALLITTAAGDNDGLQLQGKCEPFQLAGDYPLYFGIKFQISEATQSDFLVGLAVKDTTLLGGVADGVFFRKVDGTTNVEFVSVKASAESAVVVDVCAADTDVIYELRYDGANVFARVDGVDAVVLAASLTTAEELAPCIAFLTGDTSAETMTVDWVRVLQAF